MRKKIRLKRLNVEALLIYTRKAGVALGLITLRESDEIKDAPKKRSRKPFLES